MTKIILAVVAAAGLFSLSLLATYHVAFNDGAEAGYNAGVAQHKLYTKGHDMAANWHTFAATCNRYQQGCPTAQ